MSYICCMHSLRILKEQLISNGTCASWSLAIQSVSWMLNQKFHTAVVAESSGPLTQLPFDTLTKEGSYFSFLMYVLHLFERNRISVPCQCFELSLIVKRPNYHYFLFYLYFIKLSLIVKRPFCCNTKLGIGNINYCIVFFDTSSCFWLQGVLSCHV